MSNGSKLQLFISLDQSRHQGYTVSTTCTLFKLASKVGPRTIYKVIPFYYLALTAKSLILELSR